MNLCDDCFRNCLRFHDVAPGSSHGSYGPTLSGNLSTPSITVHGRNPMAKFTNEIVIDSPSEEVWAVVAAAERQAEWFPGMVSSTVENDIRTFGTAAGGFLLEQILSIDHDLMRLEYTITGPIQFEHHLGTLQVEDLGCTARVLYGQELRPEALTYALRAATRDALVGLKALVETGETSRGYTAPQTDKEA